MGTVAEKSEIKVADEVWLAAALLHREHPEHPDFAVEEIVARARQEGVTGEAIRPGVYVHVVQHCVANRRPNPGRYRMLFETAPGRRRLYRPGDAYDPEREGGKMTPVAEDLPSAYRGLLDWYRDWCSAAATRSRKSDPLLALRGSGSALWQDEHADDYVRRLREGWE
ncbi:MAG TPA: hypothetical protein VKT29_07935 [Terriglobales bacterium]|nr:hypothetical protein [Terriglobales bacterium]